MELTKRNFSLKLSSLTAAVIIMAATTVAYIAITSYVNSLFLTKYPSSWLSYLYLFQGVVLALTSVSVSPIAGKKPRLFSVLFIIISIAVIIISIPLTQEPLHWFPFVFCVFLFLVFQILSINAWNYAALIMDRREFKQKNRWLLSTTSGIGFVFGLILPLFIDVAGKDAALFSVIVVMLLSIPVYLTTKPQEVRVKKSQKNVGVNQYPLFKYTFVFGFLATIAATLCSFGFAHELAVGRSASEIAKLTSYFMTFTTIVTLYVQIFLIKKIQQRYGLLMLFIIYPIALMIVGLVFFIKATFITAIIFN